jgi:hypothetical protein
MIHVILDGDYCWPDLRQKEKVYHLASGAPPIQVAALEAGMTSGRPSVSIRLDLDQDTVVVAETSLRMFLAVAEALKARYGDPHSGG